MQSAVCLVDLFFKNGQGVSLHLFIKPTRRICDLIGTIPDIEGLVVAQ